ANHHIAASNAPNH
ncbi:hypothetical protein D037_3167B, partial [Vibrio parahaemolyticus IDH02640]